MMQKRFDDIISSFDMCVYFCTKLQKGMGTIQVRTCMHMKKSVSYLPLNESSTVTSARMVSASLMLIAFFLPNFAFSSFRDNINGSLFSLITHKNWGPIDTHFAVAETSCATIRSSMENAKKYIRIRSPEFVLQECLRTDRLKNGSFNIRQRPQLVCRREPIQFSILSILHRLLILARFCSVDKIAQ